MDRTRRQTGLRAHWCIAFALFLGAVVASMCRGGQWDGQISLQLAMDGLALFGGGRLQRCRISRPGLAVPVLWRRVVGWSVGTGCVPWIIPGSGRSAHRAVEGPWVILQAEIH